MVFYDNPLLLLEDNYLDCKTPKKEEKEEEDKV